MHHACRFHVDNLSSAHVYLRLPEGAAVDDIPADTLEDCAQLVKQNSIQGACATARRAETQHAAAACLGGAAPGSGRTRGRWVAAGCKLNDVWVVYTPWSNLKKTNGMDVGQVRALCGV